MTDDLLRHFFGGFVRLHILYHADKEPVCGVEMIDELKRHGYRLGPGTLYPILHHLEEAGYLDRLERLSFFPYAIDAIRLFNRGGYALVGSGRTDGPPMVLFASVRGDRHEQRRRHGGQEDPASHGSPGRARLGRRDARRAVVAHRRLGAAGGGRHRVGHERRDARVGPVGRALRPGVGQGGDDPGQRFEMPRVTWRAGSLHSGEGLLTLACIVDGFVLGGGQVAKPKDWQHCQDE
jgi:hypothetical protein